MKPSGYDHELVENLAESRVGVLVSLKTHHVEGLMHVKSVKVQIPPLAGDGRKYVERKIGEILHPDGIQATVKLPHSFMIWSCISADGMGLLHIIVETLNVRKYIDTILEPKLLPSIRDLFTNDAL
ncbi:transposable element Tcb1 transposase [Trichonephila clavipes]|nr:transposable element Tcb1 transposase [Trichonephila clavipes]